MLVPWKVLFQTELMEYSGMLICFLSFFDNVKYSGTNFCVIDIASDYLNNIHIE
jgi:hypothetical protein